MYDDHEIKNKVDEILQDAMRNYFQYGVVLTVALLPHEIKMVNRAREIGYPLMFKDYDDRKIYVPFKRMDL